MALKKAKKNFLDFIPEKNPDFPSYLDEKNKTVTVMVEHRGFYAMLAQKLAKTPRISKISLDQYGSFIWGCIDGHRTIAEITQLLEDEFGGQVQPALSRVARYFQILKENLFVSLKEA